MKIHILSFILLLSFLVSGCYTQLETIQNEPRQRTVYTSDRPQSDYPQENQQDAYDDYYSENEWEAYEEGYYDGVFDTEIAFRDYGYNTIYPRNRNAVNIVWGRPFIGFGFYYGYHYDPYWHYAQLYDPYFFWQAGYYAYPYYMRYHYNGFFYNPYSWNRPLIVYNNYYNSNPDYAYRSGPRGSGVHRANTNEYRQNRGRESVAGRGATRSRVDVNRSGTRTRGTVSRGSRGTVDRNRGSSRTSRGTVGRTRGSSSSGTVGRSRSSGSKGRGSTGRSRSGGNESASPARSRSGGNNESGRSRSRGGGDELSATRVAPDFGNTARQSRATTAPENRSVRTATPEARPASRAAQTQPGRSEVRTPPTQRSTPEARPNRPVQTQHARPAQTRQERTAQQQRNVGMSAPNVNRQQARPQQNRTQARPTIPQQRTQTTRPATPTQRAQPTTRPKQNSSARQTTQRPSNKATTRSSNSRSGKDSGSRSRSSRDKN